MQRNSVDTLISEPIGTYLVNERMLETYVIARDLFLNKTQSYMFPTSAHLCIVPFEDQELHDAQTAACAFWDEKVYFGLDLTVLKEQALQEKFAQPIIDTYDPKKNLSSSPNRMMFDFQTCSIQDLKDIKMEFKHKMERTGILTGYCLYFDAFF